MNRKFLILLLVVAVLAVTGVIVYRQMGGGTADTVLVLPEGDLLVYANVKPLHFLNLNKTSDQDDRDYQEFVRETGIDWGRDLDNVALSLRNPGANSDSAAIFTGHFDSARLNRYLQKFANATEHYADKTIYSIPHEGRTVRVSILGPTMVAVSNVAPADQIHGMIDKFRNSSLRGRGPYLFESHFRDVPFGSVAWAIYRPSGNSQLPGGLGFDFLENSVAVASLRYSGSIHFKAQVFTNTEAAAQDLTEKANGMLSLYKGAEKTFNPKGNDRDVKEMIDSIAVKTSGKSAVITATIPEGFIQKASQNATK